MKQTAFLSRQISIFGGWFPPSLVADWTGSVEEFWSKNDSMTYGDINDMRADLDLAGSHRLGGGASPCFTIRYASAEAL